MKGIYLDIDAINKRCGSADWYFNLLPDGELVIVIRKRNVCEVISAVQYLTIPFDINTDRFKRDREIFKAKFDALFPAVSEKQTI